MERYTAAVAKGRRQTAVEELSAKLGTEVSVENNGDGKCTFFVRTDVANFSTTVRDYLASALGNPDNEA